MPEILVRCSSDQVPCHGCGVRADLQVDELASRGPGVVLDSGETVPAAARSPAAQRRAERGRGVAPDEGSGEGQPGSQFEGGCLLPCDYVALRDCFLSWPMFCHAHSTCFDMYYCFVLLFF